MSSIYQVSRKPPPYAPPPYIAPSLYRNSSRPARAATAFTPMIPPMPTFFEPPYVCTQSMANNEQQPLQNLPPVTQTSNCRRLDNNLFDERELTLEPRVLGLRSQWYINELHESKKVSPWKSFSGWIWKASEKMAGQGRSHQGAAQLSRSENLARQPRVKPQRAGVSTWVASSSNLDQEEQPVAWTYYFRPFLRISQHGLVSTLQR